MSMTDELRELDELHQRGALSDAEFARAKARVIDRTACGAAGAPRAAAINGLRRSRSDRWLGGVCGGLAELSGVAAWVWRLAFVLAVLCGGTGIAVYLLLCIFVPAEPAPFDPAAPRQPA